MGIHTYIREKKTHKQENRQMDTEREWEREARETREENKSVAVK